MAFRRTVGRQVRLDSSGIRILVCFRRAIAGCFQKCEVRMNSSLITSAYTFVVVFGFLSALALAIRSFAGRDAKSAPKRSRVAPRAFATDDLRDDAPAWPDLRNENRLAPPPVPRDELDYHHAADYVLDPRSPYPIPQPPRRDEGEW